MVLVCCVKVIPWWCSQFNFLFLSLSPFFFFIFFYLLCRVVPPWGSGPVFSSTYSSFFFKYREVPKRSVLFPCISLLFLSKRYMYMKKKLWENYEKNIYIHENLVLLCVCRYDGGRICSDGQFVLYYVETTNKPNKPNCFCNFRSLLMTSLRAKMSNSNNYFV